MPLRRRACMRQVPLGTLGVGMDTRPQLRPASLLFATLSQVGAPTRPTSQSRKQKPTQHHTMAQQFAIASPFVQAKEAPHNFAAVSKNAGKVRGPRGLGIGCGRKSRWCMARAEIACGSCARGSPDKPHAPSSNAGAPCPMGAGPGGSGPLPPPGHRRVAAVPNQQSPTQPRPMHYRWTASSPTAALATSMWPTTPWPAMRLTWRTPTPSHPAR